MTHEMDDGAVVEPNGEKVHVPRRSVEQLYGGVVWLLVLVVGLGLVFAWDAFQDGRKDARQDATDEHLAATDDRLEATADQLADLVEDETVETARVEAQACVSSHARFALLNDLLAKLGAAADLTQQEIDDLLATYPAPGCDLAAAKAVLAGA